MARGQIAKDTVVKKIAAAFGQDYIGEIDKKLYVFADDGGERVQIAIALTCPKASVPVMQSSFPTARASTTTVSDITEEEKANIALLMRELDL